MEDEFNNDINGSDFYGGGHSDFDPMMDDDLLDDDMEGMHITSEDDDYDPDDRFH